MVHNKQTLLQVIDDEIEDRSITQGEVDMEYARDIGIELMGLVDLRDKVEQEQPLSHVQLMWVVDLVDSAAELRES